jgi:predicted DNA-binding protein YlxM (UPF0122 family)
LIDIIANAPVNAFISTIIEIAQHYNLTREFFWLLCVRIKKHTNYFEDLEQKIQFFQSFHVNMEVQISIEELTAILIEEYGYTIEELVFSSKISWAICDLFLFQKQNTTTFI